MLDPCNQVLLCVCRFCGDEDRVVTGDRANHAGPSAAIERKPDSLCGTNTRAYDQQVRTGGRNAAQQLGDGSNMVVCGRVCRRQFITPGRLDRADFTKVPAYAGLRSDVAEALQCSNERGLRFGRPFDEQVANRRAPLNLVFRRRGHNGVRYQE